MPYRCFILSLTGWVNVTAKRVAWSRFGRSVRPATLEVIFQGSFREECNIGILCCHNKELDTDCSSISPFFYSLYLKPLNSTLLITFDFTIDFPKPRPILVWGLTGGGGVGRQPGIQGWHDHVDHSLTSHLLSFYLFLPSLLPQCNSNKSHGRSLCCARNRCKHRPVHRLRTATPV